MTARCARRKRVMPTPDTEGQIDELPFLAVQGVGLVHDVAPVGPIIERIVAEAVSALSAVQTGSRSTGRAV